MRAITEIEGDLITYRELSAHHHELLSSSQMKLSQLEEERDTYYKKMRSAEANAPMKIMHRNEWTDTIIAVVSTPIRGGITQEIVIDEYRGNDPRKLMQFMMSAVKRYNLCIPADLYRSLQNKMEMDALSSMMICPKMRLAAYSRCVDCSEQSRFQVA